MIFSDLTKGDRFRAFRADGTLHDRVYTKVAKKTAKDSDGQWFDVNVTWPVQRESEPHVVGSEAPTVENDPIGRFRQHQAEDPHCTCPDCLEAYQRQLGEQP